MKIVRALVSVLVVMGIAASVSAAPKKASRSQQSKHEHRYSTAADPQGIDLVKYPKDEKAPMSIKRQMELGLKVAQLRYDWWGLNWHREIEGGRWLWEKIPAGKIVLVDKNGNQIYKADCVNRLVWMPRNPFTGLPCPKCPPVAGGGNGRGGAQDGGSGFFQRLADGIKSLALTLFRGFGHGLRAVGWILAALGALLLNILPWLLLALVLYLLYRLIRWIAEAIRDWRQGRQARVGGQPGGQPGALIGPAAVPAGGAGQAGAAGGAAPIAGGGQGANAGRRFVSHDVDLPAERLQYEGYSRVHMEYMGDGTTYIRMVR